MSLASFSTWRPGFGMPLRVKILQLQTQIIIQLGKYMTNERAVTKQRLFFAV